MKIKLPKITLLSFNGQKFWWHDPYSLRPLLIPVSESADSVEYFKEAKNETD